jgi:hypothetical protein
MAQDPGQAAVSARLPRTHRLRQRVQQRGQSASWPVHRSDSSPNCSPAPGGGKPASSAALTDHTAFDAFHAVQAHGSGRGLLIATVLVSSPWGASLVLINVGRFDVGQATELAVVAA